MLFWSSSTTTTTTTTSTSTISTTTTTAISISMKIMIRRQRTTTQQLLNEDDVVVAVYDIILQIYNDIIANHININKDLSFISPFLLHAIKNHELFITYPEKYI